MEGELLEARQNLQATQQERKSARDEAERWRMRCEVISQAERDLSQSLQEMGKERSMLQERMRQQDALVDQLAVRIISLHELARGGERSGETRSEQVLHRCLLSFPE